MFINELRREFLIIAKICVPAIANEVHGEYSLKEFYQQRIQTNSDFKDENRVLIDTIYQCLQIFTMQSSVPQYMQSLEKLIDIYFYVINENIKKHLMMVIDLMIVYYYDKIQKTREFLHVDYKASQVELSLSASYKSLSIKLMHYSAMHPNIKKLILNNINDSVINALKIRSETLVLRGAILSADKLQQLLDEIRKENSVKNIVISNTNITNEDHLVMCELFLLHYHKLETFSIEAANYLILSNVWNEFLSQRNKLFVGMPADTKLALLYSESLFEMIDCNYLQDPEKLALNEKKLETLTQLKTRSTWEGDVRTHLIEGYKNQLGKNIKKENSAKYLQYYLSLNQTYFQLKFCFLYNLEIDKNNNAIETIIKNAVLRSKEYPRDLAVLSLEFVLLLLRVVKNRKFKEQSKNIEDTICRYLELLIDHFLNKNCLPNKEYDNDVLPLLYTLVTDYTMSNMYRLGEKLSFTKTQCSYHFILKILTLVERIYSRSTDPVLRQWAASLFIPSFNVRLKPFLKNNSIPTEAFDQWDSVVNLMRLDKNFLDFGKQEASWMRTGYSLLAICLSQKSHRDLIANNLFNKYKKLDMLDSMNITVKSLETLGLKPTDILTILKQWYQGFLSTHDEMFDTALSQFCNMNLYFEIDSEKGRDRIDSWDTSFPLYLIYNVDVYFHLFLNDFLVITNALLVALRTDGENYENILLKKEIYQRQSKVMAWSGKIRNLYIKILENITANEAAFRARYNKMLFVQSLKNQTEVLTTVQKQVPEVMLKVCNAKLLELDENIKAALEEFNKPKKVKPKKKKKAKAPIVVEQNQIIEDSVESYIAEDEILSGIALAERKLSELKTGQYYERARLLIQLADCYHSEGEHDKSQRYINEAKDAIAIGIEECEYDQKSFDHFTSLSFALFDNTTDDNSVSLKVIQKLIDQGDLPQAITHLKNCIEHNPKRKPLMLLAQLYRETMQYHLAINCYESVLEKCDVDDIEVKSYLVHCYCKLGLNDEAFTFIEDIQGSRLKLALDAKMHYYMNVSDHANARIVSTSGYMHRQAPNYQCSYAKSLFDLLDFDEAEEVIEVLLERKLTEEMRIRALRLASNIYYQLEDKEKLNSVLKELHELSPAIGNMKKSEYLMYEKKFKAAYKLILESSRLGNLSVYLYSQKIRCELKLKKDDAAKKTIEEAISIYPGCDLFALMQSKINRDDELNEIVETSVPEPKVKSELAFVLKPKPILLDLKTPERVKEFLSEFKPNSVVTEISQLASNHNLKVVFYGAAVYQMILGKSTPVLDIAIQDSKNTLTLSFLIKMFNAKQSERAGLLLGQFKETELRIRIIEDITQTEKLFENWKFSSEQFIIDPTLVLRDPKDRADTLLRQHEVVVNTSQLHSGALVLSTIRYAHDNGLKINDTEFYVVCSGVLASTTPQQWLAEFAALPKSADPFNTIGLWLNMRAFEFIIPRLQFYLDVKCINKQHIFAPFLRPKKPELIQNSYNPGIRYLAECVVLLRDIVKYVHNIELRASELVHEIDFYSQLTEWQQHELKSHLTNVLELKFQEADKLALTM